MPTLTTPRLRLRPLTLEDAPAIFAYAQDPEVSRYTAWEPHRSLADSEAFIRDYALPRYAAGLPEPYGLTLPGDDRVVGTVGCFAVTPDRHTMELAYALARPLWGQGLVCEAARALLDHVFAHFPVRRLQARCKQENLASARVMEKLGMRHEGVLRAALWHRGRDWDMVFYSVLRHEWPGAPPVLDDAPVSET
ncbi:MAG: GNAT family N-acetyltransferase [Candidatus Sericytochromatia bacterium]|nr:GNAT family N-acetyltransferase [Candidatus Sericytochromatia bacterium]